MKYILNLLPLICDETFQTPEAVDRCSETGFQMTEKNKLNCAELYGLKGPKLSIQMKYPSEFIKYTESVDTIIYSERQTKHPLLIPAEWLSFSEQLIVLTKAKPAETLMWIWEVEIINIIVFFLLPCVLFYALRKGGSFIIKHGWSFLICFINFCFY